MKGDAARSLRALTAGISRAALACSVLAAAFYAAGNRNGLSDAALGLALDLAAVAAAAGPVFTREYLAPPGTAFLIDLSASMGLPDGEGGETRTARAAAIVEEELASLDDGAPAAVFSASAGLELVAGPTTDRRQLARAAAGLAASDAGFREAAVSRDLKAWIAARSEAWRVVLLSDGGPDLGGRLLFDAAGGALTVRTVGTGPGPLCVGALAMTPTAATFTLHNHVDRPVTGTLRLSRDGLELATVRVEASPRSSSASIPLSNGFATGGYLLELLSAEDGWDWARDDEGSGIALPGSTARTAVNRAAVRRILVVGVPDAFLRASLERDGFELRGGPAFPDGAREGQWDLAVSVGVPAPAGFPADILSFGEPPADAPFSPGPEREGTPAGLDERQALSRYVDWSGYGSIKTGTFSLPPGSPAVALAAIRGAPVAAAWEDASGWRRVALAANPAGTAFTLSPSWPVLLRNIDDWFLLSRGASAGGTDLGWNLSAGDPAGRRVGPGFAAEGLELERAGPRAMVTAPSAGFFPWTDGTLSGLAAANPPASETAFAPKALALPSGDALVLAARLGSKRSDWTLACSLAFLAFLAAEWLAWRGPLARTRRGGRGRPA